MLEIHKTDYILKYSVNKKLPLWNPLDGFLCLFGEFYVNVTPLVKMCHLVTQVIVKVHSGSWTPNSDPKIAVT